MITPRKLLIKLKSSATFSRGDGVAGLIDREVEHDEWGMPYIRGKTLKGLLAESAENVVFALDSQGKTEWRIYKDQLFGKPGKGINERGNLHISDARLPLDLQNLVISELSKPRSSINKEDILYSLTATRVQTSINPDGAPEIGSLRSMRVVLPILTFESNIAFERDPENKELYLLNAAALDLRNAGTVRNRGRGWIEVTLNDEDTTRTLFDHFAKEVSQ